MMDQSIELYSARKQNGKYYYDNMILMINVKYCSFSYISSFLNKIMNSRLTLLTLLTLNISCSSLILFELIYSYSSYLFLL